MNFRRLTILCLFTGVLPAFAWAEGVYRTRSLSPEHKRELRQSIAESVAQINAAQDVVSRGRYQEELCKKLLQAEDYESALKVAHSIFSTPGIEPERRAAHHYMIAQIYAYRMKASPTVTLMEENRRMAAEVAADVVNRNYPKQWMVTEAAKNLLKELNDRKQLAAIRSAIEKRKNGGVMPANEALARSQSVALERSEVGPGAASKGASLPGWLRRGASSGPTVTIGPRNDRASQAEPPATQAAAVVGTGAAPSAQPRPASRAERIESVYAARHDRPGMAGGLIIDGGSVRPVSPRQDSAGDNP
jgi:hypothetical protein